MTTKDKNQLTGHATFKKTFILLSILTIGLFTQARLQAAYVTVTAIACPDSAGQVYGGGVYDSGTVVTLMATPADGYVFTYWTVNGMLSSMDTTFTGVITADVTFEAHFMPVPDSFTVSTTIYPEEAGYTTGTGVYLAGNIARLVAHTNPNYTFSNWSVNGIITGTDTIYSFEVMGNVNVVANWYFTPHFYTITTESFPANGGSTTGDGSAVWGAEITLTAIANTGYTFTGWAENGEFLSPDPAYSFTVTAARHLSANFALSTSVEELVGNNPLSGMPTTSSGRFDFTTNTDWQLSVFNTLGQLVTSARLSQGRNSINIAPKGMYIVSLTSQQNQQTFTKRVMVQ